jgi:hypothetical protein
MIESVKITKSYKFRVKELRKKLGITGEILHMVLYKGRSPNDREQGKSSDEEVWEIITEEIQE